MRIRRGSTADLDRLVAIDPGHRLDRRAWLTGLLTGDRATVLVAESAEPAPNGLLGYLVMAPGHFFERDFIELLVVRDDARRRGVGTRLVRAAVAAANTAAVFTSTNESNVAMRALLAEEAWSVSGSLVGLDPGDPEIVYFRHC